MKLSLIASAAVLLLISSCGNNYPTADDGVYFQDFDNVRMWARDQWNLTSERAHSGSYSARTDSTSEYSQTFEMDYAYAKGKGYKALQVSGWVFLTNMSAKAGIVASCESPAGSSAYESADLKEIVTAPEQWQEVNVFMKIPESAPEGSKIKVYMWSPNKAKIFLDDVLVQLKK